MDEFTVKSAPSIHNKKHSVFKLHKDDTISWNEAKIRRDNDYQPWQIKLGSGRAGRRFKAIKEGGVNDNASYFIFYKPDDKKDTYEVCPVDEWYSVSATQRYKTLTAEEAEQKFEQRHKMLNFFSVMHLKKNGENGDEVGGTSKHDSKSFKISELDDWDESGEDDASDNDGDNRGDDESNKKIRRKKNAKKEKDDPDEAPDEGKEESDEGDFEQREVDYMSDTSSSSNEEQDDKNEDDVKGIAEEEALRELLSTDDEEDTENPQQKSKISDSKTALGTVDIKHDPDGNSSEDSSDSDDYDVDEEKMDSMFMKKGLPAQLSTMVKSEESEPGVSNSRQQSNTGTYGNNKRKISPEVTTTPNIPPPKRPCPSDTPSSTSQPANAQEKIVEDLIRKYLSRKPMTPKNLLREIRNKMKRMQGATPEMNNNLVNTIATIIKRLQPDKQKINEVIYLSFKS